MISFPIILLRLGLALVLGALIGLEREIHEHTAGMRTNALVALGSSLFTIISAFGFASLLDIPHVQLDPTRIASYVVAGIGFLGGGSIIVGRDREKVRGLTTAAAIWVVAALGMACGAGLLVEAIAATILVLIVLVILRFVERLLIPHRSSLVQHLLIESTSVGGEFVSQVYNACVRSGITVAALKARTEQEVNTVEVACHVSDASTLAHIVGELHALPGVREVHAEMGDRDKKL